MSRYTDDLDENIVCPHCNHDYAVEPIEAFYHNLDGHECGFCHRLIRIHVHFSATKMDDNDDKTS